MSRKKIRYKPVPPPDGVERWRCPNCKELTTDLVFHRPTAETPVPPDPSFVCRTCDTVWDHSNGAVIFGDRGARAVMRVLQIQGKLK
jgi:rubredoxin